MGNNLIYLEEYTPISKEEWENIPTSLTLPPGVNLFRINGVIRKNNGEYIYVRGELTKQQYDTLMSDK